MARPGAEPLGGGGPHARAGASLAEEDLDAVLERTEGWPAALYLVALALRDAGEGPGSAARVAGDDRDLVDYLSAELLTRLPPERLSFLLRTSVLDRISAPLCDAILGRQDSAQEIAALVQSNLFVQPLDRTREWYRYHHLFREPSRGSASRGPRASSLQAPSRRAVARADAREAAALAGEDAPSDKLAVQWGSG